MKKTLTLLSIVLFTSFLFGATTFFSESFGSVSATTAIATHETNNGFDVDEVTYSGTADIRNTTSSSGYTGATGLANVFFTNTIGRYLLIEGINSSAYSNITMSLGHYKNNVAANNELTIEVSSDGTNWTALSYSRPGGSANWILINPTGTIPSATNLRVRFTQTSASYQFRIDDIKLSGDSQSPSITTDPLSLTDFYYEYNNGPSGESSFSLTGSYLTDNLNVSASGTDYEIASSSGGSFGSSLSYIPSGGSVSATVYVRLKAGLASGSYNNENISCSSSGATTQNVTCSGTVYKPEPSNHVTNFTCGTTTISTIPLSWTDAAKTAPDGYLIKGSNVGFSSITAPVDGTPEPDAALVKNVAQGSKGSCTFTNLSSNTTYYFKIYPYTNSENAINYKTDGTVPQASATTQKEPDLIHYWNFNTNPPTSPANWPQPLTADIGTGSLSYNLTEATSFGGSTLNGVESEVAGGSFVPVNQSNNGNYFTLAVPTNGYSNIIISYATRGTATGFSSQAIYYSTDGVNFNLMTTFTGTNVTDWSVKNIDFSSIPAVNNNQNFMIRIVVSGATSASGNNRFDNIKILGNENPLPVELTSFTADFTQSTTGDMYVSIKWTTQSETALAGYYLYRGTTNNLSAAEQIPSLIVPANSSHGASYEFIDREIQSGTTYYYWLQSMEMNGSSDFHGPVSVTVNEGGNITPPAIITETRLLNAYPNPFNPTTTLCYTLKERGQVKIEIYNVRGQLIRSFMPAPQDKGYYQIIWDGKDLNGTQASSGAYYVRMTCGKYVSSQRIVLMK